MHKWWLAAVLLLMVVAPLANAARVRAFVDRDQVSLGDTITLNIQSDGAIGNPDLAPLQRDFQVLGTSRSSSLAMVNGQATRTTQLGIALKPKHSGTLVIPALTIDGTPTAPLTVTVGAAAAGGTGRVGDPAFMESDVSPSAPWVGQQVVYTVRLYYLPDVQGSLADPSADGARLVPLDRDRRYRTQRNGYTYDVIERSWALIPDRAGPLTVKGPAFQGQRTGSFGQLLNDPNALLNNPNALLNGVLSATGAQVGARAPVVHLNVRPAPANAGKPWLPARDVQLKLTGMPAGGKVTAGVPLKLVLSVTASGQPADALPEPELPPIAGARVYPDQSREHTDASGEWLAGTRTRSFAVIPERDGTLTVPAITLNWWNVAADQRAQATLPAQVLHVTGAVTGMAAASAPPAAGGTRRAAPTQVSSPSGGAAPATVPDVGGGAFWRWIALASVLLWVIAIGAVGGWWWRSRRRPTVIDATDTASRGRPAAARDRSAPEPQATTRALQRAALDAAARNDPAACGHALLVWARATRPELVNLAALRAALGDAAQQAALDALQRARWHDGDAAAACAAVARAFAPGLAWCEPNRPDAAAESPLPPLYPQ